MLLAEEKSFSRYTRIDQTEAMRRTAVVRCYQDGAVYSVLHCDHLNLDCNSDSHDRQDGLGRSDLHSDVAAPPRSRWLDQTNSITLSLSMLHMEIFRHTSTSGRGIDHRLLMPVGDWIHRLWNGSLCVVAVCR